ncbi:MAG: hypothetical protein D6740_07015, partial [Alphaproteobacteria bacterium]
EYIKGQAEIGREGAWQPAGIGMAVHVGEHVRTGESSRIRIRFADGSSMQMGSRAEAVIERYAVQADGGLIGALLDLLQGRARFIVEKLKRADAEYKVRLRTVLIGVRGTDILAQSEIAVDHVALVEGRVALSAAASPEVVLDKGFYARAASGRIQRPVAIPEAWLRDFILDVGLSSEGRRRKQGDGGEDSAPASVIQQQSIDQLGSPVIVPR